MNGLDFVLIIIIALFTIRGIFRGLITELIVLIALVAGSVLAYHYMEWGKHQVMQFFSGTPESAAKIIAFILIFLVVNIVLRLFGRVLNKFASFVFMQPVNRLAGGAFAFLKSVLIIGVTIMLLESLPVASSIKKVVGAEKSQLYHPIHQYGSKIYHALGALLPGEMVPQKIKMPALPSLPQTKIDTSALKKLIKK